MKISTLSISLMVAPLAVCLAQTPAPQPTPQTPKAAVQPPAGAGKSAMTLEDIPGADPIVLTVGDEHMTKTEFERLIAAMPDRVRAQAQGPGKRQVAEQIVQLMAMAQEARKRGIDKTADTRQMVQFQTDSVLANALFREISNGVRPDDAAARAYYEKHKADFEEVTARHILIRFKGSPVPARPGEKDLTEEEALAKAQEIRKRLLAGEDFAKVATAESDDVQTGKEGGSLGSFSHGRMVPQFEQAAFKQPVGEIGEPLKTQFGYHIIKVEKHDSQKFEDVKAIIDQKLKPELAQKAVDNIRSQAPVNMSESYFGKPETAPPAAPAK